MDGFLQMLERAVLKQKDGQELLLDEVGAMFAMSRLRMLEQEWRVMKLDQEKIEKPDLGFSGYCEQAVQAEISGI